MTAPMGVRWGAARTRALVLVALVVTPPLGAQGLEIGEPDPPPEASSPSGTVPGPLEELRLEAGFPVRDGPVSAVHHLHARLGWDLPLSEAWSLRLGGRFDAHLQTGGSDLARGEGDYDEAFLRYRDARRRITVGAQRIHWGRVDERPPTDGLGVQDLTRLVLDDLEDRRRAVPALRWEEYLGAYRLDMAYIPRFRAAELPPRDGLWHPVDRDRGRILGMAPDPLLAPLVRRGRVQDQDGGSGGGGVRLSHSGTGLDYALSVQRSRRSAPYYALTPAARRALRADPTDPEAILNAAPVTLEGLHPYTWRLGGDLAFDRGLSTWRFEAAWISDRPVTTADLRPVTAQAVDWVAGVEFFPGDADLRVNLQLGGSHRTSGPDDLMDAENVYTLFGDAEQGFGRGRWQARLRYALGLDPREVYLNPRLAYVGREPHEIYAGYHHFEGEDATLGGFHERRDLWVVGWRARF
ncbi:MAG: hypothetical protein ACLFMW_03030 [Ectothiorhodospira sp.]